MLIKVLTAAAVPLSALALAISPAVAQEPTPTLYGEAATVETLEAPATPLPAKLEIIKSRGSSKLYLKVSDDVVAPIANPATLRALVPAATPIKVVPTVEGAFKIDATIDQSRLTDDRKLKPAADPVNTSHRVVKDSAPAKPAVYVIDECNRKRPIADWETFLKLKFKPENIERVTTDALQKLTNGPTVSKAELKVKYVGQTTVLKLNDDRLSATSQDATDDRSRCDVITLPTKPVPMPLPRFDTGEVFGTAESYYLDSSVYKPVDSGYGYPWLIGSTSGYVSLKPNQYILYRSTDGAWQKLEQIPVAAKEVLSLCQKLFSGTYAAVGMDNQNYVPAWRHYLNVPEGGWTTFACLLPPQGDGPQPGPEYLGGTMYWYGKVTKYLEPSATTVIGAGRWVTDPDGVSGGNLDAVRYCQKWYRATKSATYLGIAMADDWRTRGLGGGFKGAGNVFGCSAKESTTPTPVPPTRRPEQATSTPVTPNVEVEVEHGTEVEVEVESHRSTLPFSPFPLYSPTY